MRYESTITTKIEALEIQYFLDDPDDDPSRFGDGYYFRSPGDASWNGPWIDADECRDRHREQLEFYYASLERKMAVYEATPLPGTTRYLLEFSGILDPTAFDVHFFLWIVGPGRPSPMNAIIDASCPNDIPALLDGTVLVYGAFAISEISGTIDEFCQQRGLTHPSSGPN